MCDVSFEAWVAKFYFQKVKSSMERGVEFNIPIMSVMNILKAKKCYYTGIKLTRPPYNAHGYLPEGYKRRNTDVTIERLDNSIGYLKGNIVACSLYANGLKSVMEDPCNGYSVEHFIKMAKKLEKLQ